MTARLGNVLYWLGCGIAALYAVGGIVALSVGIFYTATEHTDWDLYILSPMLLGIGGLIWLAGRALRYILAGI